MTPFVELCDRQRRSLLEVLSAAAKFRQLEFPSGVREYPAIFKTLSDGFISLKKTADEITGYGQGDVVFSMLCDDFQSQMDELLPLINQMMQTSKLVALQQATKTDFETDLVAVMQSVKAMRSSLDALVAAAPF